LLGNGDSLIFTRGSKLFELTNHLGNVLSTISDKRYGVTGDDSTVAYYNSDVVSANDYYPGGMEMPGRTYVAGNGYRYGYQGSEKDKELNTNTYTTLFREDDTRINRWWSPDPKSSASPWSSPYVVNGNNPIIMIDPFGDQEYESMKAYRKATGNKKLGQGDWLSKDRTGNTDVWKTPILIT
jgi:RHS repeat-associated protein